MPFDAPIEMLAASPVTPAHVITMRERQEQFRLKQGMQEKRGAEEWSDAWREEEARSRQAGNRVGLNESDESHARPSAMSGEQELRRILQGSNIPDDRELAKRMFPWLKL